MLLLKFWNLQSVRLCFAATTLCFSGVTVPNSAFIWLNEHSDARATGQSLFSLLSSSLPLFSLLWFQGWVSGSLSLPFPSLLISAWALCCGKHFYLDHEFYDPNKVGGVLLFFDSMQPQTIWHHFLLAATNDNKTEFSPKTDDVSLFILQRLDYETRKAYTFKVEASNAALDHRFLHLGPFKDTATVKVNVLDVEEPPVFSRLSYRMETYEDTPVGIIVGAVTAEDLDVGNSPVR